MWDAPEKILQGDSVNTNLLVLLIENTLEVLSELYWENKRWGNVLQELK